MTRVVAVLVFDQVKLLDVAGPVEVFAKANRHGADYEVQASLLTGRTPPPLQAWSWESTATCALQ